MIILHQKTKTKMKVSLLVKMDHNNSQRSFARLETIKVYDGNASMKRRTFRTITISRSATKDQIIAACLRAFHIHDDPRHYIITDAYGVYCRSVVAMVILTWLFQLEVDSNEKELSDFMPVQSLTRIDNKRMGLYFR